MLTRRERVMRIFKGEPVDRPALKLWGAMPGRKLVNARYEPIANLAFETSDIFATHSPEFNVYFGAEEQNCVRWVDEPCDSPGWMNRRVFYQTPLGELSEVERISLVGAPGYTVEHMIKEPGDIKKLLSVPYAHYPVNRVRFEADDAAVGDRGVCMMGVDHAGYALSRICGSELFATLSVDEPELMEHTVDLFAQRIREHVQRIIGTGLKPVYSWVGPELIVPPLMNLRGFERYAFQPDKLLCDMIHNSGGYVWVHCHGRVALLIERFIQMGVDVLNPLEPPKNGDVSLADVAARYGGRIGLEGNIEIQDILESSPERLRALIEECVAAGAPTGRFILCPSAGYAEYVEPTDQYLENLLLYLTYGLELLQKTAG